MYTLIIVIDEVQRTNKQVTQSVNKLRLGVDD